jgi:ketosteroid isomerase-like protein
MESIASTITRLFAGVDKRDWRQVENTMDDKVLLDYTSMAGGTPTWLTPCQITDAWAAFLPGFDRTHHQLSDFEINETKDLSTAHYEGKAEHFIGKDIWVVEGTYDATLRKKEGNWVVSQFKFNLKTQSGNTALPTIATDRMNSLQQQEQNRKVVDNFFTALETPQFELLKTIFAENGRQLNPYAPEGFPESFDGSEDIYRQYSGLTANFGQMRFPRQIFATEDPNFFFVLFKGKIEINAGGTYENDYLGTFRLENGKIREYTEYFNQIVMAKAFGTKLN